APEFSPQRREVPVLRDTIGRTSLALPLDQGATLAYAPTISADGTTIAYIEATQTGQRYLRLHDRISGSGAVLTDLNGQPLLVAVEDVSLSPDGRYVLFAVQHAGDVSTLDNAYSQTVVFDRVSHTYQVVSVNNGGELSAF